jgi:hypothetical protein
MIVYGHLTEGNHPMTAPRRPPRPGQLTTAVRELYPDAALRTTAGPGPHEYTITMPHGAAWHWAVHDPRGAWQAGQYLTGRLGRQLHVSGVTWGKPTRRGQLAHVLVLDADALRSAAHTDMTAAGYSHKDARAVLDEARQFPGRWAYTGDRRRAVVFHMPAGRWTVHDTEDTERRIRAAGLLNRNPGWRRVP